MHSSFSKSQKKILEFSQKNLVYRFKTSFRASNAWRELRPFFSSGTLWANFFDLKKEPEGPSCGLIIVLINDNSLVQEVRKILQNHGARKIKRKEGMISERYELSIRNDGTGMSVGRVEKGYFFGERVATLMGSELPQSPFLAHQIIKLLEINLPFLLASDFD